MSHVRYGLLFALLGCALPAEERASSERISGYVPGAAHARGGLGGALGGLGGGVGGVGGGVGGGCRTDRDGDGYTFLGCDGEADCDDNSSAVYPGAPEIRNNGVDENCDGEDTLSDFDGDGWTGNYDCNDLNRAIHPNADEACDDVDNDCDGEIDEDPVEGASGGSTWYLDADGDGFGDPTEDRFACDLPDGYSADGSDCDDTDASVYPGAPDMADGEDNDCDGYYEEDADFEAFGLYISEVMYYAPSVGTGRLASSLLEYVELTNDGNADILMHGWVLTDREDITSGEEGRSDLPDTVLASGERLILAYDCDSYYYEDFVDLEDFSAAWDRCVTYRSRSSIFSMWIQLKNDGDQVQILMPSGDSSDGSAWTSVAAMSYTSSSSVDVGESIYRCDADASWEVSGTAFGRYDSRSLKGSPGEQDDDCL